MVEFGYSTNLEALLAKKEYYLGEKTNTRTYLIVKLEYVPRHLLYRGYRLVYILFVRGEQGPRRIVSCGSAPVSPEVRARLADMLNIPVDSQAFTGYGLDTDVPCTAETLDCAHPQYDTYNVFIPGECMYVPGPRALTDTNTPVSADALKLWQWDLPAYNLVQLVERDAEKSRDRPSLYEEQEFPKPVGEHLN